MWERIRYFYYIGPKPFFRLTLLATPSQDIHKVLRKYEDEGNAIEKELYDICWYMRGSITREDAFRLTRKERKHIKEIIDENIERTKKTGLPLL